MTHKAFSRYLEPWVERDLTEKMVFISGPRQVGKTTLSLALLHGGENHPAYFNWDYEEDQKRLLRLEFPPHEKLLVFDEIHKYKRWRNWLKGIYDKTKSKRRYLITGSARLDLYRRGGDALTGRYHFYRLHPLSLAEVDKDQSPKTVDTLLHFGGYPEPFFAGSETKWRRWQRERLHQVLREDLRDLERVDDVVMLGRLVERLPALVGSPLSLNNLREDLQVAHRTVQNWVNILEKLFVVFRIFPYGSTRIRAVKKEAKAYLWDWSMVTSPGGRFENFVACQLLKYCHFLKDTKGHDMELRYIRDTDKREVDFVVLKNQKPLFAVECKLDDAQIGLAIPYFVKRLTIPRFFLVHLNQKRDFEHASLPIRVLPYHTFSKECGLP